jgi:hypothetical protein
MIGPCHEKPSPGFISVTHITEWALGQTRHAGSDQGIIAGEDRYAPVMFTNR